MKKRTNSRFHNYVLWAALASLIGLVLQDLGVLPSLQKYNQYVETVLYVLAAIGVINNPSIGKGFKDVTEDMANYVEQDK